MKEQKCREKWHGAHQMTHPFALVRFPPKLVGAAPGEEDLVNCLLSKASHSLILDKGLCSGFVWPASVFDFRHEEISELCLGSASTKNMRHGNEDLCTVFVAPAGRRTSCKRICSPALGILELARWVAIV